MTDVVEVMARASYLADIPKEYEDRWPSWEEIEDESRKPWRPCTLAALAALNEAGYAVVPLNATLEMCRAGHQSDLLGCDIPDDECEMYYSRVYAAMLSAAQPAPK